MQPIASVNGQLMPLSEVRISALDRGFLFGDSVYEVLRIYQGKSWLEEEHFQRLGRSLESIRIHGVDLVRLHEPVQQAEERNQNDPHVAKDLDSLPTEPADMVGERLLQLRLLGKLELHENL